MNFKHSLVFALLLTGGASFSEAATTNVSASVPDVLNGTNTICSLREDGHRLGEGSPVAWRPPCHIARGHT